MNKEEWIEERATGYLATGTPTLREALGIATGDWYDMYPPAEDY